MYKDRFRVVLNEFMIEIKKKDREERAAKKEQSKKDFVAMLKEFSQSSDSSLDRYTYYLFCIHNEFQRRKILLKRYIFGLFISGPFNLANFVLHSYRFHHGSAYDCQPH